MRWQWIALMGLGCTTEQPLLLEGGQTGEDPGEDVTCDEEPTELDPADESPLGFSAADLLAAMGGEGEASFTYVSEEVTGLVIGVWGPTEVRYLDLTPVEGEASDCVDHLAMEVVLGFTTDDGAFDEVGTASLIASTTSEAHVLADWDAAALAGSFGEDFQQGDTLRISATWTGDASHGTVRVVYAEGGGGGASSSSDEEIGSW